MERYGYNSYYNYIIDNETDTDLSVREASEVMNDLVNENLVLKNRMKKAYDYFMGYLDELRDDVSYDVFSELYDVVQELEL